MHQIAVNLLPEPCIPHLLSYCPTMDLVATVTVTGQQQQQQQQHRSFVISVEVWRLNGQRVFGILCDEANENQNQKNDNSATAASVAWRNDGRMLAIATSDHQTGVVRIVDCFNGKVVKRIAITISNMPEVSRDSESLKRLPLSWTTHFANPELTRRQLKSVGATNPSLGLNSNMQRKKAVVLDDLLGLNADIGKMLKLKADLPAELVAIDLETSLPKLATLPATGADDDVFSTRNSIDAIFHSENARGFGGGASGGSGTVDALLISRLNHCSLQLCIFDSFEIGVVDVSVSLPKGFRGRRILKCASHSFLSTHFLLVEAEADSETSNRSLNGSKSSRHMQDVTKSSLHLLALDLRFIPQTSHNLPLLAKKATQLQNLLRYISQIQKQLAQELKAAFDLPGRFLRNVNESLAEQDSNASFLTAAYHLAVTGECYPQLKEWLVDEIGERGLKRWEKAVGDCLETARRMVSECLLPALERCQVVLSRLDGLSRFSETANKLGLDEKGVKLIRETLDVLSLLAEDLLKDVCLEIKEFAAFMRWMKWEAEVESLEDDSEKAEELRENWTGESELRTVLEYIGGAMQKSRLSRYIDTPTQDPPHDASEDDMPNETATTGDDSVQFYANYKSTRKLKESSKTPQLARLLGRLKRQSDKVFSKIAETLRKNTLAFHMVELSADMDRETFDIRVIPSAEDQKLFEVIIVSKCASEKSKTQVFAIKVTEDGGKKMKYLSKSNKTLACPEGEAILDVKFVDDTSFLVLATNSDNEARLCWHATDIHSNADDILETRHVFERTNARGGALRPAFLEVNGRKGRRVVTVADEKGMGYMILDLDAGDEDSADGEDGNLRDDDMMTG